jgi:hypothetical protein
MENDIFEAKKLSQYHLPQLFPSLPAMSIQSFWSNETHLILKKCFAQHLLNLYLQKLKPKCCLPCLNNKGLWKWIFLKQKKLSRYFHSAMLILELFTKKDFHHSETNFLKVFANLLNCHLKNSCENVSCLV